MMTEGRMEVQLIEPCVFDIVASIDCNLPSRHAKTSSHINKSSEPLDFLCGFPWPDLSYLLLFLMAQPCQVPFL